MSNDPTEDPEVKPTSEVEMDTDRDAMTITHYMSTHGIEGGVCLGHGDTSAAASILTHEQGRSYVIGEMVAQGGMGAIMSARDLNIRRNVAMKVMLRAADAGPQGILRFIEEAQVTGQLEHPSIVPVHELGVDTHGDPFYTMKFVRGVTLRDVIEGIRGRKQDIVRQYPLHRLLTILQKVCDAVSFAHARGVVHRDLKPANIMLGDHGEVLVMDWGLAKVLTDAGTVAGTQQRAGTSPLESARADDTGNALKTMDGQVMGTPAFMAPEQAMGRTEELDHRADIYALGAILYCALVLRPPVHGETIAETLHKTAKGDIIPPSACAPLDVPSQERRVSPRRDASLADLQRRATQSAMLARDRPEIPLGAFPHCPGGRIPAALSAVAMKALGLDPADRYQSVAEFQADIEAYQSGFATTAEEATVSRQLALLLRRHKVEFALVLAALCMLVAVTAGFIVRLQRANAATHEALVELRDLTSLAAPRFFASARGHMARGEWDTATAEIRVAVGLDPNHTEAWHLKGCLHLAQQQFDEAVAAFDRAGTPESEMLSELTTRHARTAGEDGTLSELQRFSLATALQQAHENLVAAHLLEGVSSEGAQLKARVEGAVAALRSSNGGLPELQFTLQVERKSAQLSLQHCEDLIEIAPLAGLPLTRLWVDSCGITDISALRGMPLQDLTLNSAPVLDIGPLKGMKLTSLHLHGTRVTDIQPLAGMLLRRLHMTACPLSDISAVAGMPLESLSLAETNTEDITALHGMSLVHLNLTATHVTDITPLEGAPLSALYLDKTGVTDLTPLKGMPLALLTARHLKITDLTALRGLPLAELELSETLIADLRPLEGMELTQLGLDGTPVRDISVLRGMPLKHLYLDRTRVQDISPLQDMPIEELLLHSSQVRDISVLPSTRLRGLWLGQTRVMDLTALTRCRDLERLGVHGPRDDLDFLKTHPSLKVIQYTHHTESWSEVKQSTTDFWRVYDAAR